MFRPVAIVALIGRSKLVPDFALTIHILHLLATSVYSGAAPRNAMWWFTMLASSGLCVALGMWGCRYRELQPVFFGGGRILGSNARPTAAAAGTSHDDEDDEYERREGVGGGSGDEEMGLTNGRGRVRGREESERGKMQPGR